MSRRVRNGGHLLHVRRRSVQRRDLILAHASYRLAAMEIRAIRIIIERSNRRDRGGVTLLAGSLALRVGALAEGGTLGVILAS